MPIRFRCAYCNQLMGIARRKAGTVVKCPKCAGEIIVPTPESGDAATNDFELTDENGQAPAESRDVSDRIAPPTEPSGPTPVLPPPPPMRLGIFLSIGTLAVSVVVIVLLLILMFVLGLIIGKGISTPEQKSAAVKGGALIGRD